MLCHQPPRFDWCPQSIYTIYSSFHIASAALEQHLRSLPCAMSLSFSLIGRDKTMQCYSHRTYLSVSRRPNNTEVMELWSAYSVELPVSIFSADFGAYGISLK